MNEGMNLRSGETTEKKIKKPKQQKSKQRKNMATGEQPAETDVQTLMLAIKSEITAFRQDFNKNAEETKQEIGKLTREIKGIQEEVKDTKKEVIEAQDRISNLEDKEPTLKEIISHLLINQSRMAARIEYLENKSRQNNIRIYQVKEGAEGADMVKFIEELIRGKLGIPDSELFIVAAHRSAVQTVVGNTPRQEKPENPKPRSIIVRFLTWQTKQRVLDAAWDKERTPIKFDEENIYFDHDYSSEIMNKRRQFTEIRKQLKESGIKSHFKHPAKLKVKIGDGEQVYNTATEAYAALQAQGILGEQQTQSRTHAGRSETRRKGKEKLDEKTEALLQKLNGKY